MTPRNTKPAAGTAPVFHQREQEGGRADPAMRIAFARCGRDLPARHRRARHGCGPVPQEEADAVMLACGEREPAGRGQVGGIVRQFGDDAGDAAAFERFLHREQRVDGAAGAQHQKVSRWQPEQMKADAVRRAALKSRHIGLDQDRFPSAGTALSGERRQRQRKAAGRAEMGRRRW